jgi:hypothetical protein
MTDNAGASDDMTGAHFVPLSTITDSHNGSLEAYMRATGSRDVVITMQVTMEVAGSKGNRFFVALGVTWNFDSSEPLADAAATDCPKAHKCLFGWVPAHRFGQDDFGIYIDDIGVGETLQNGMVAEIIEQAGVEAAVMALTA